MFGVETMGDRAIRADKMLDISNFEIHYIEKKDILYIILNIIMFDCVHFNSFIKVCETIFPSVCMIQSVTWPQYSGYNDNIMKHITIYKLRLIQSEYSGYKHHWNCRLNNLGVTQFFLWIESIG